MCLSQESLERAGVRQELMPFVYKLTKFSFEFTVQDVVVFRTSCHFSYIFSWDVSQSNTDYAAFWTCYPANPARWFGIVLFLKDALHNFNIGSIQWMIHLDFTIFSFAKITSPVATSQNNRAGAYHFDSHHLENNDKKCLNVRRSSVSWTLPNFQLHQFKRLKTHHEWEQDENFLFHL